MSKHTQGPWMTAPSPISYAVDGIHGADGSWVCDVPRALVGEANAKLIALAPEMYETLRRFVEAAEISFGKDEGACGGTCNICQGRAILERIDG